jgi:hypothetical protein
VRPYTLLSHAGEGCRKQVQFPSMSAAIINLAYLLAVALFVLGLKAAVASAQGGLTSHPFILVSVYSVWFSSSIKWSPNSNSRLLTATAETGTII